MQRILVTGGCGFIGSNFVRHQLATYPELSIINLDKLTYAGNPENLADLANDPAMAARYEFACGDICDQEFLTGLLQPGGIDAVIHFAAESHVDRSILDSGPFVQTNIVGTQVLLDCCRQAGISRYVQVSTDEVYGSLGDDGKFTEETPLAPNSPYSASKTAADLLVRAYFHTFGFPAVTTRCSNNYGPYQFPEKLIPLFISNASQDQPLPVYGTGLNRRDWLHVDDHCDALLTLLTFAGVDGETFNIGAQHELDVLTISDTMLRLLGKPSTLIRYVEDRPGHDRRYAVDSSKLTRVCGWTPRISFEEGIVQTVQWFRANESWWRPIKQGDFRVYYERMYGQRKVLGSVQA